MYYLHCTVYYTVLYYIHMTVYSLPILYTLLYYMTSIDRYVVYVPMATHEPLKTTHDDHFFKLCKLRGIAYDAEHQVGTLFLLPDTIMTGSLSILCLGKTRQRALELAVTTLSFVQKNYGVDKEAGEDRHPDNLSNMLVQMKKTLKIETTISNSTSNNNNNHSNNNNNLSSSQKIQSNNNNNNKNSNMSRRNSSNINNNQRQQPPAQLQLQQQQHQGKSASMSLSLSQQQQQQSQLW
jgi:hypothetical protein